MHGRIRRCALLELKHSACPENVHVLMHLFKRTQLTTMLPSLQNDVPDALNKVLDTLPTRLEVKGLPFTTTFEYSIFTFSYVLVQGKAR